MNTILPHSFKAQLVNGAASADAANFLGKLLRTLVKKPPVSVRGLDFVAGFMIFHDLTGVQSPNSIAVIFILLRCAE